MKISVRGIIMKGLMKKSLSVAIAVLLLVSAVAMFGASAAVANYTINSGVLTKCLTSATGVVNDIPSTVTEIRSSAFKNCNAITEVVIPAGVTKIGNNAFDSCTSLKKITFQSSNCTIGSAAFIHCSALETITLPSGLTQIPNEAFYDCTSLKSITIPSGVTLIGKEAFNMCRSLTGITIPASVKTIRANAFLGCSKVTAFNVASGNTVYSAVGGVLYGPLESPHDPENPATVTDKALINYPGGATATSFSVPSGTLRIASDAFNSNKTIQSVTLPSGLKSIESHAFFGCTALKSINIPSSVTSIGSRAFDGCSALKSVVIPSSVTSLENAFSYSGLTSVEFADGAKIISTGAFSGCGSLATVKIPASVTTIESGAFNGCPASMTIVTTRNSEAHRFALANGFNVSLTDDEPTVPPTERVTVVSVEIFSAPDKTDYYYKEKINTTGLELLVTYSDGSRDLVNSGYTLNPDSAPQTGAVAVEVEYAGCSDYFTINVSYAWWQWIIRILLLGFLWY